MVQWTGIEFGNSPFHVLSIAIIHKSVGADKQTSHSDGHANPGIHMNVPGIAFHGPLIALFPCIVSECCAFPCLGNLGSARLTPVSCGGTLCPSQPRSWSQISRTWFSLPR